MRCMYLLVICVLLPTPAEAVPFDFSADYGWRWNLAGPILLLADDAPGVAMTLRPMPPTSPFPIIHFTLQNDLPPACVGCALTWTTLADIQGEVCSDGPFACSQARFSLVGESSGWALTTNQDPPVATTPEPVTILLLGMELVVIGFLLRKRLFLP